MRIFSGIYKGRVLHSPKGIKTRPTSGRLRESLFNICQGVIKDRAVLDLFAGSGAIGLEALSRGASFATFVDNSSESIRCIHANIELLKVKMQTEVIFGDIFIVIDKLVKRKKKFDLIYADPPYEACKNGVLFSHALLKTLDGLIEQGDSLLTDSGILFIEEAERALSNVDDLKHLELIGSRNMGRSCLQQYEVKR